MRTSTIPKTRPSQKLRDDLAAAEFGRHGGNTGRSPLVRIADSPYVERIGVCETLLLCSAALVRLAKRQ
eukprot:1191983-Prorocentrum_minimum.AAC.1